MQRDLIYSLLTKLDGGRHMAPEELRYLKSVFESSEGRLYVEERIVSAIESATDHPSDIDFDYLYARIERRIKAGRRVPARRALRRVAAALLALAVAGGAWLLLNRGTQNGTATIVRVDEDVRLTMPDGSEILLDRTTDNRRIAENLTRENGSLIIGRADMRAEDAGYGSVSVPHGTRFDMVLEDGTHVWLNAGSRLRFPASFGGGERRVELDGEAWFEVTADASRPFIVETEGQQVRVLGTSFNVSAYRDEGATCTTLVEGSVTLRSDGGGEVTLRPGQQAILNAGDADFTTAEAKGFTPWKDGVFVFEGNTLGQVMRQLSRWYDMEYSFADGQAGELVLRGIMPIQTDISCIFDILETSGRVRFTVADNRVTIRSVK